MKQFLDRRNNLRHTGWFITASPEARTAIIVGHMQRIAGRGTALLAGIGLVLIGLLGGILLMLVVEDAEPQVAPRMVDRVELGSGAPIQTSTGADSGLSASVPPPAALNNLFREVASRVTPAVVYIQVEMARNGERQLRNFDDGLRERFFQNPPPRRSVGSGVIISNKGHVVTNYHVVENAEAIRVTLADKRQFDARVVGSDASTDLAVLKLDTQADLPAVAFGNSDQIDVGEWVVAVGNPFRLTSTVTAGIVSALGRQVGIINDRFRIEDFIQTDAAINPGNSGGALVNLKGELVGISTAIATESGSYEGYGFAVPSNLMRRVVHDLIAYGEVRRGYMGVTIQEIDASVARELGLKRIRGVYIGDVQPGGAADRAGIQNGDVVLTINGRPVDAPNELQSIVARYRPGEQLTIKVWRDGVTHTYEVQLMGRQDWNVDEEPQPSGDAEDTPDRMPEPSGAQLFELEAWGLGIHAVASRERKEFGVDNGVYIAYVQNGSVAAEAGLPRDVVITRIDQAMVRSVEEALKALERANEQDEAILIRVRRRDGTSAFYEVQSPDSE